MAVAMNFNYQYGNIHWMDTPAQRLKTARKSKGVSQVQLALVTGIDQSTISDIENDRGLSAEYLMRLCEALDLTPQYVMRGQETNLDVLAKIKALVTHPVISDRVATQNNQNHLKRVVTGRVKNAQSNIPLTAEIPGARGVDGMRLHPKRPQLETKNAGLPARKLSK